MATLTAQYVWITQPGVDFLQLQNKRGGQGIVGGIDSNGVGYGGLAGGGGGGSSAFSAITAGTNTAALVVGTGGSLSTSGSGTIAATSAPFSGLTGSATEGQLPATTVFTDAGATFGAFTYNFTSSTLVAPTNYFQTNGSGNASQSGLNLINGTAGAGQIAVTNPGGTQATFNVANFAGGGATLLAGTLTSALQNDIISVNGSGVLVNKTPGVAGRTVSGTSDTINCAAGGDRGTEVVYTSASLVTVTIGQAGTTCLSNFYVRLFTTGAGGIKVVSTTSTLNGVAAGTGITYLQNTWVDITSLDNTNWTLDAARAIKGGTNITEVLNADGSVTFNAASGGTTLNAITSATAGNTALTNGNFPQVWNWAQTTNSQTAFALGDTSAATGGTVTSSLANQALFGLSTAAASTETPFSVTQGSVTGTVAFPAAQISTTWNNAGLTAAGLVVKITNTASASGSLPLQVLGGAAGASNLLSLDILGQLSPAGNIFIANSAGIQASAGGISYSVLGGHGSTFSGAANGNLTLAGGSNSSTTTSSAGGNVNVQGGDSTAASGTVAGGNALVRAGGDTSATGAQGLIKLQASYFLGAGTTTLNGLQCMVAATSMTVNDCGASAVAVIGVASNTTTPVFVTYSGETLVLSTNTAVVGHTVCTGATGNSVTDSGGTAACTNGTGVGIVISITQNGASGTLPLVLLRPH
jgi:hypothetical protein